VEKEERGAEWICLGKYDSPLQRGEQERTARLLGLGTGYRKLQFRNKGEFTQGQRENGWFTLQKDREEEPNTEEGEGDTESVETGTGLKAIEQAEALGAECGEDVSKVE